MRQQAIAGSTVTLEETREVLKQFRIVDNAGTSIVDTMQASQEEPGELDRTEIKEFTHAEIVALHSRFDELQKQFKTMSASTKESAVSR